MAKIQIKVLKNAAFFCEGDIVGPEDIDFNPDENKCDIWFKTKKMSLVNSKAFFEKEFIKNRLKNFNYNIQETSESLHQVYYSTILFTHIKTTVSPLQNRKN